MSSAIPPGPVNTRPPSRSHLCLHINNSCFTITIHGGPLQYYKISRSERTPLSLNPSQISPDTQDSGGLGMFVICKKLTSLDMHTIKTSKDSGREEDH